MSCPGHYRWRVHFTGATSHMADGLAVFLARKIECVRFDTADIPPPPIIDSARSSFMSFRSCSQEEVRKIVRSSPIKTCSLDPVPTFILREFIDVLLPFVAQTVNTSLLRGRLPDSQKHAIVTPLLKKAHCLVSNLSFMSKLIEKVVANQLNEYLSANDLLPRFNQHTGRAIRQKPLCISDQTRSAASLV